MGSSKTLRDILKEKGHQIYWLPPDATVYEAIEMMATKSVGALLVLDEGKLVGIISERDYARKVILKGKSSKETKVSEIMSSPVIYVTPDCPVEEAMALMTEKRIRHLPVVENDQVVGIVSIGDLVKFLVKEQEATIRYLHAYISGSYPG